MATKPTANLVETTIEYVDIDDEGDPVVREEDWYLHFTFRTLSETYKRIGVDENRAQELAKEVNDGDRAEESFQQVASEDIDIGEEEAVYYMVWGAMRWHAEKRGRSLTPQDVGDMLTPENANTVAIDMRRAIHLFHTGEYLSHDEMKERVNEERDAEPASGEDVTMGKSPRQSNAPVDGSQ